MGKFVNPFTDIGFKRIFGQEVSKPLLLDFLNNLLKGERTITDLRFLDKEQPADYRDDRSLIYDIYCQTDTGEKIIVEMQNKEQPNFADRCLYYYAQAVSRQGEKGADWDYHINAVYLVAFVNFHMDGLGDNFRTDVVLMNKQRKEVFSDKERFIFLQLPVFHKEAEECKDDFERWIYVLKNMEILDRMPWAAKDSVFRKLAEIGEVSNMTKDERIKYDAALRHYRDTLNVMRGAEDKGRQQGLAEGRLQGLSEGRLQGLNEGRLQGLNEGQLSANLKTAKNLLSMGLSIEQIAKATGLDSKDIEKLQ
ncbi:MAG: Rpn family recombination-promoting nuclease/putative transposase [Prevotellaceae bacterium]|nr:Rpn family recombination-promoting nuclease/putative transposase [Prevotellaceae bacterium]